MLTMDLRESSHSKMIRWLPRFQETVMSILTESPSCPRVFPQGGLLKPGDIVVSNFNDMANVQGTGTTIVDVAPNNQV
jgi:hypothetical protein